MDVRPAIIGSITGVEAITIGNSIREAGRLRKVYGKGRWRKLKGFGAVRLPNGNIRTAEIHWYEASGIGKFEFKIKRLLD